LIAAKSSRGVGRSYVVTGSPPVKGVSLQYGAVIVDPPEDPLGDAGLRHGYRAIHEELSAEGRSLELLVVLSAQSPAVTADAIDLGIEALQTRPELDSAASVFAFDQFSPSLARREGEGGLLEPFIPYAEGTPAQAWYPDWSLWVLRPRCLEGLPGPEPLAWLGRKVHPLKQWGVGPIAYRWQLPALEAWLGKHGYSNSASSYEPQPKLQPAAAPKPDRR
jgi:hypothetical protein